MLNELQIRALKPSEKPRKVADAKALYLRVMPSGEKIWRMKYFFPPRGPDRKEKTLTIGPYPEISLKDARDQRDEARRDLRIGIDPMIRRRAELRTGANTFEAVAKELLETLRKASTEGKEPSAAAGEVIQRTIQPRRKRKPRKRREPISAGTIDTMQVASKCTSFPILAQVMSRSSRGRTCCRCFDE